jgi:hypothetical protein
MMSDLTEDLTSLADLVLKEDEKENFLSGMGLDEFYSEENQREED